MLFGINDVPQTPRPEVRKVVSTLARLGIEPGTSADHSIMEVVNVVNVINTL